MTTSARDAWSWPERERQRLTRETTRRPGEMLAAYGKKAGSKCGTCRHFTQHGAATRCHLATPPAEAGYQWSASFVGCGKWERRDDRGAGVGAKLSPPKPGPAMAIALPLLIGEEQP